MLLFDNNWNILVFRCWLDFTGSFGSRKCQLAFLEIMTFPVLLHCNHALIQQINQEVEFFLAAAHLMCLITA